MYCMETAIRLTAKSYFVFPCLFLYCLVPYLHGQNGLFSSFHVPANNLSFFVGCKRAFLFGKNKVQLGSLGSVLPTPIP